MILGTTRSQFLARFEFLEGFCGSLDDDEESAFLLFGWALVCLCGKVRNLHVFGAFSLHCLGNNYVW